MLLLAVIVGLYPLVFVALEIPFEFIKSKSTELQVNQLWNVALYIHVIYGGIALITGCFLFIKRIITNHHKVHRFLGKIYVVSALLSAVSGVYIAFYANGGWIASLGFIALGALWFYFTLRAFLYAKSGNLDAHKRMAIYSYALCFAAVTFRIWNPFLSFLIEDQQLAYQVAAWEGWLPNLFVAFFINKKVN